MNLIMNNCLRIQLSRFEMIMTEAFDTGTIPQAHSRWVRHQWVWTCSRVFLVVPPGPRTHTRAGPYERPVARCPASRALARGTRGSSTRGSQTSGWSPHYRLPTNLLHLKTKLYTLHSGAFDSFHSAKVLWTLKQ